MMSRLCRYCMPLETGNNHKPLGSDKNCLLVVNEPANKNKTGELTWQYPMPSLLFASWTACEDVDGREDP